jgi:hypothetical protein
MRTITSVTLCTILALLLMPQLRAEAGVALGRSGLVSGIASYTEEGGRMLAKTVNALMEDIMPTNSDRSSTRR